MLCYICSVSCFLFNFLRFCAVVWNDIADSGHGSETVDLLDGESVEVSVYTRSTSGAKFTITESTGKTVFVDKVEVKHFGSGDADKEVPTSVVLNKDNLIKGPCKLKIKADSDASRFSTHNYLLVFCFKA